jgi:hypothetical protein
MPAGASDFAGVLTWAPVWPQAEAGLQRGPDGNVKGVDRFHRSPFMLLQEMCFGVIRVGDLDRRRTAGNFDGARPR